MPHEVFPVYHSARSGQYTYHGPGELVVYVMLDIKKRNNDVRKFVQGMKNSVILTSAALDLVGKRKLGMIGVWLDSEEGVRKIATIGVKVTKGISWHGLALNINPDLSHYSGIIQCGLRGFGTTSLRVEGVNTALSEVINII